MRLKVQKLLATLFLVVLATLYIASLTGERPPLCTREETSGNADLQQNNNDRIYFMETSGRDHISFRQSCAVESAARLHPDRPIQLFLTSDTINTTSRPIQVLGEYKNIVVETVNLNDYFNKTPLENWYHNGTWRSSPYSVVHMSDYLRILSVYKGGGQYLDLDFVVIKPLNSLRNYVVYEDVNYICNGVFHFDEGHPIVTQMVQKLADAYNPGIWGSHGPVMVTSTIYSNCNITKEFAYGPNCGPGVNLVNSTMFLPVPYPQWEYFMQNNTSYEIPERLSKAYAVHMWNTHSKTKPIIVGSSQHYSVLAAKYCPLSFAAGNPSF